MTSTFTPSEGLLEKYADLLVNFALGGTQGVKKGDVVMVYVPDVAKPFLRPLQKALLEAGTHPLLRLIPTGIAKDYYTLASEEQLKFFPENYEKARVDLIDHSMSIIANHDPFELKNVDPKKILLAQKSRKLVREWIDEKEYKGNFTWTLGLYGTEAMAKESGLTLREYWDEIIKACYLDFDDPKVEWKRITKEQERIKNVLNDMSIEKVHVESSKIDLYVGIGKDRSWEGGSGRNIPSFEIFTSPHMLKTEGHIEFNQPLYRYGNRIEGIKLEFKKGKVSSASASKGQNLLEEMISTKNANMLGEFSLTDSRFSRITKFMANTLFDENIGGEFGNTHVAIGKAYKDCYKGDPSKLSAEQWKGLGYNDSVEHCDIISTEDRSVTAFLSDGASKVIYKDGKFTV